MPTNDRLDALEKELKETRAQVEDLQKWKANCTLAMAAWGGVCMAALTTGGIIIQYYDKIKASLMTLWSTK